MYFSEQLWELITQGRDLTLNEIIHVGIFNGILNKHD
jgi:hypothetical protein